MKPQLEHLRLCHRFGKGSEAHITKLPQELLEMVIEHLVDSVRSTSPVFAAWEKLFKCFEFSCRASDHFDEDTLAEIREELEHDLIYDGIDPPDGEEMDKMVEDSILQDCEWEFLCVERRKQWRIQVAQKPSAINTFHHDATEEYAFNKYDKVSSK